MKKFLAFILITFMVAIVMIPALADPYPGDEPDIMSPIFVSKVIHK